MTQSKKKSKKPQKKGLGRVFVRAVVATLVVSTVAIGGLVAAYKYFLYDEGSGISGLINKEEKLENINKTLAVFGVDEDGYRTDVIFVVNYDTEVNQVKVVSIPRDTKVEWNESQNEKLLEYKGYTMDVSKINEMTTYGGIDHIRDFTINEIEDMLGIPVDNYIIITIDAFKELVDAVGGVEVDVPALDGDGLHYDDNSQDLHIHLDPGVQVLNGEQAEGLVRFRKGYAEGDVGRIKTQQLFLDAFAKKLLSPSIITKIPKITSVLLDSIKTDIPLSEISHYYGYLKGIDANNISFNIIPGEAAYQNSAWYFIADEEAMPQFVQEVFYNKTPASEEVEMIEDKTVTIEILNSTTIAGAASRTKNELENLGYSVTSIDNYNEGQLESTIIYTKDLAKGKQFEQYFTNAVVEENTNIPYDIQIILGQDIQ